MPEMPNTGSNRTSQPAGLGNQAQVVARLWITPDVCSGTRDMSKADPQAQKQAATKRTTGLQTEVAMWPTPNTAPEAPNMSTNRGNGQHRPRTTDQCLGTQALAVTQQTPARNWMTPKSGAVGMTSTTSGRAPEKATALQAQVNHWAPPDCNTSTYSNGKMGPNIREQAAAWPTSNAHDGRRPGVDQASTQGTNLNRDAAQWTTPSATDHQRGGTLTPAMSGSSLTQQVNTLNTPGNQWPTPNSTDSQHAGRTNHGGGQIHLVEAANNWPSPAARDHKSPNSQPYAQRGGTKGEQLANFVAHQITPDITTTHTTHPESPPDDDTTPGLFAPGPSSPRWPGIIARWPHLAPATDKTPQPGLRGMADGLAHGLDDCRPQRLKCIGNGVVALCAAAAFITLVRRAGQQIEAST